MDLRGMDSLSAIIAILAARGPLRAKDVAAEMERAGRPLSLLLIKSKIGRLCRAGRIARIDRGVYAVHQCDGSIRPTREAPTDG